MPEIINYGASAAPVTGWTTPANAVGAPNATVASCSGTTNAYLLVLLRTAGSGFDLLPADAVIKQVFMGKRASISAAVLHDLKPAVGDTAATGSSSTSTAGVLTDFEYELDFLKYTPALLKDPAMGLYTSKTNVSATFRVDAVWMRAVYDLGIGVNSWATGVTTTGSWSFATRAVGAPDDSPGSSGTNGATMTATMGDLDALPDNAVLEHVYVGLRTRAGAAGNTISSLTLPESTTPTDNLASTPIPILAVSVLGNVEVEVPLASVTVERLKRATWRAVVTKSGASTWYVDGWWTRVVYSLPATSRAKRWDGDSWENALVKRWDGSAWVTAAAVKRWDGSAWV